jgi:hypothetical protein
MSDESPKTGLDIPGFLRRVAQRTEGKTGGDRDTYSIDLDAFLEQMGVDLRLLSESAKRQDGTKSVN